MMKAKWQGDDLYWLLNLTMAELRCLYPDEKKGTLSGKRNYWRRKLESGEIKMPPKPEKDPFSISTDLGNIRPDDTTTEEAVGDETISTVEGWWDVVSVDRETGEPTVTRAYKYSRQTRPGNDTLQAFTQATPARITPSRRKPLTREYNVIAAYGDLQAGYREVIDPRTNERELIPLHDEAAMAVARFILRDVQPDLIVNLSDSVDLSSLSRFKKDSNHFNNELGPAFQRVHNYYAELRADNPKARIVEVASNHNQRLNDYVLQNFPQAYNLYRPDAEQDYPILSYPYLANLKHVGVEWMGGYPAGELIYGEEYNAPPIIFRHGTDTSSNGTTASKIMKRYPETHNVHGHSHETGEAWHTTRNGRYLGSFAVGALCRIDGVVPSYWSAVGDDNRPVYHQEQWQQSILIIKDYKNGEYEFIPIMIRNGIAYYNGRVYDGNED